LARCPGCRRTVRVKIVERHMVERDAVATTLPEYPLDSGVISYRSVAKLTVECPLPDCKTRWQLWP
jgi:hypothetical protein